MPLTKEKLDELDWVYKELKVIIIDEMSMVSSNNLYDIHKRLTTIFKDDTKIFAGKAIGECLKTCLLYTSPSPRDGLLSRMPSSA